ncbi:MAG: hypothetical protein ACJ70O_04665 [Nitrososphaera sp.]
MTWKRATPSPAVSSSSRENDLDSASAGMNPLALLYLLVTYSLLLK